MAIKNITSYDPIKSKVVKLFKDKFSATKITTVKFNTTTNTYTANCFQKFSFLGNKEINANEMEAA